MKKMNSIVWGIALIAVSAVLLLNAFQITNIEIFFDGWWTLFIIVPSIIGLFTGHDKTADIIGLLIGVFLLLACQNIIDFDILWKLVVPVVIAVIGIKMIFGGIIGNRGAVKNIEANTKNQKTAFAAFFERK